MIAFVRSLGMPSWLRSAFEWIGIGLVGVAVAALVFVAVAPRLLGWHFVVVAGGSMEPTIHFGSVAVMADTKPSTRCRTTPTPPIRLADASYSGRRMTES